MEIKIHISQWCRGPSEVQLIVAILDARSKPDFVSFKYRDIGPDASFPLRQRTNRAGKISVGRPRNIATCNCVSWDKPFLGAQLVSVTPIIGVSNRISRLDNKSESE
jgi:hypothetical protein